MLKKTIIILTLTAITGCAGNFRDNIGLRKKAPDEFKVVSNPPLVVPPDFSLRPPTPGARNLSDQNIDQEAKEILIGNGKNANNSKTSKGEDVLLQKASTADADPNIKDELTKEEIVSNKKEGGKNIIEKTLNKLKRSEKKSDPVINAKEEKKKMETKETKPKEKATKQQENKKEPVKQENKATNNDSLIQPVFGQ